MAGRPNYYLLLDLDPSVDDWTAIERRILEKKRQWGSDKTMGNPAARRKAEHNLSIIRDIEQTLKNPETRKLEAKEALREKGESNKARLEELNRHIPILKANGRCTKEEFSTLVKQYAGILSEKEIEKLIRGAGIPIDQGEDDDDTKEYIDPVTASNIKRNLDHLKTQSLYEFLDRNSRSSPKSLHDRADEINKEVLRVGKTDPDSSARKELAGICLAIFLGDGASKEKADKEKEKYDNTLAVESMERLKPQIEFAGTDGFLIPQEIDALVKQAVEMGVQRQDAIYYLKDYAKKRKWKLQTTGSLSSDSLKQCRYCFTLSASAAANRCSKCGEDLSLACPQCGTTISAQDNTCSNCGCYPGDSPVVKALLREAKQLSLAGKTASALDCIKRAQIYWPNWSPLLEESQRIEALHCEREAEFQAIESLINSRMLLQARAALDKFIRLRGAVDTGDLKKSIEISLARVEALFLEAEQRRKSGKQEDAIAKYEEALSLCNDFQRAREALASCPPPPPANLQVHNISGGVRLNWQGVKAGGSISYKIVRKANGFPIKDTDGSSIGETKVSQIDDIEVDSGTPFYYSVYTIRGGIPSTTPASSGPHLVTAEVKNLTLRAGNREVVLNWEPPKGCKRVEVWRKSGNPPAGSGDGERVTVTGNTTHDTGVVNGSSYGYLVAAVFDDPLNYGKEIYTAGIRSTAFPVNPPNPITDLTCNRDGKRVTFKWTPVTGASTQIRQTTRSLNINAGLMIPLEQAETFGELVATISTGNAQANLTTQGLVYFIPLTITAGTAVVGNIIAITTVEDITNLKVQSVGKNIVLTWDWPSGIEEVLVCYAHDKHPADPVNTYSSRARVTKQEYFRNNCWELRGVVKQPHYFTLFAKALNSEAYSSGAKAIESMGQSVSVHYRVVLKKAVFSRDVQDAWMELQCEERASLPGLLVIGKQRNVPISPRDGTLIADISEVIFHNGKARITIPRQHCNKSTYVKLFFKDHNLAQEIRLIPAPKEELALG